MGNTQSITVQSGHMKELMLFVVAGVLMGCSKDPAEKISQSELEGAVNLMVKNFESIEALAEKGDAVAALAICSEVFPWHCAGAEEVWSAWMEHPI